MSTFKPLFKNNKFLMLWISQFASQIAVHTLNFLVILIIFEKTGSTIATSLVWMAFIIPAITIAPIASALVDYYDKRKIMLMANALQAVVVILYALVQGKFVYLAYGVVLAYPFLNQFYIPAEVSSLPLVVKKKYLTQANGLFLATYQLALIIGFGLAGVVGDQVGFDTAFLFSGLLLTLAFVVILKLPDFPSLIKKEKDLWKNIELFYKGIIEGFSFIMSSKMIYYPFAAMIGLQVLLSIVVVSLPSIAVNILKINPNFSGILMTVPACLGAIMGILLVPKLSDHGLLKRNIVELGMYGLELGVWPMVIVVPYLPSPYRTLLSLPLFLIIGISFIFIFISSQTILQTNTPPRLLGRIFGNAWFFTTVATVLPMMFAASVVEVLGPKVMFAMLALTIIAGIYYYNKEIKYNL